MVRDGGRGWGRLLREGRDGASRLQAILAVLGLAALAAACLFGSLIFVRSCWLLFDCDVSYRPDLLSAVIAGLALHAAWRALAAMGDWGFPFVALGLAGLVLVFDLGRILRAVRPAQVSLPEPRLVDVTPRTTMLEGLPEPLPDALPLPVRAASEP